MKRFVSLFVVLLLLLSVTVWATGGKGEATKAQGGGAATGSKAVIKVDPGTYPYTWFAVPQQVYDARQVWAYATPKEYEKVSGKKMPKYAEAPILKDLVSAGKLPAAMLAQHLQIFALGTNLLEFFSDSTHVFVAIGGVLLAFALARGRVKILRLTQRISALFGTYVGGRVRDRIMSAEGSLAETKDVAVLFSDIRGFTAVTERSEASAVVQMLNLYFSEWDRVSRAHGGIIDKFIGDAVMIIFEPRPGGEPSQDAVRCARAMLGGLGALRARLAEKGLPPLSNIGVGIACGPVILGNIGSTSRRNYTAIGDTVNTASRLEAACKQLDRTLIVSGPVHELLDEDLRREFTCLGEATLKGKSTRTPIFGASPV